MVRLWHKHPPRVDPICIVTTVQASDGVGEYCLNATAYLSIGADHRHPFMTKVYPSSLSTTGVHQVCLSPAQVDPFYSQGESLSSDDRLDQSWVTVFGYV